MRANSHLRLQIECVPLAYFCGSAVFRVAHSRCYVYLFVCVFVCICRVYYNQLEFLYYICIIAANILWPSSVLGDSLGVQHMTEQLACLRVVHVQEKHTTTETETGRHTKERERLTSGCVFEWVEGRGTSSQCQARSASQAGQSLLRSSLSLSSSVWSSD